MEQEALEVGEMFLIIVKFFLLFNTQCLGSCQGTEGRTRRSFLNVSKGF